MATDDGSTQLSATQGQPTPDGVQSAQIPTSGLQAPDSAPTQQPTTLRLPEQWAHLKEVPRHVLAGVYVAARWQAGHDLVSEAQFDSAVKTVLGITIR